VPILATTPIGSSLILSFNALNVYVAQCYPLYTASVLGGMAFSRCFIAFFGELSAQGSFDVRKSSDLTTISDDALYPFQYYQFLSLVVKCTEALVLAGLAVYWALSP
jgi:hypothetical protein